MKREGDWLLFHIWSSWKDYSPKMTSEYRPQGCKGVTHMAIWRKTVPGKEKSTNAQKGKCIWMWNIHMLQVMAEKLADSLDVVIPTFSV